MNSQKGQVILILILVMTVALSIGLSIVQKSLVDVSTASKVEQSSRAFSAAEAGIEKALQPGSTCGNNCIDFSDNNSSKANVSGVDLIPAVPASGSRQAAVELPPLAKEDVSQVWLASPDTLDNYYKQTSLDVYWGSAGASGRDQPAIEISIIYQDADGSYKKFNNGIFIDPVTGTNGQLSNGFRDPGFYAGGCLGYQTTTTSSPLGVTNDRSFKCKISLSSLPNSSNGLPKLILLRTRLLYNSTSQPFAIQPPASATCGTDCSLPPQARSIISTGVSGDTQRKVNVFQLYKVVPPYFDYAIFSAGEIKK